MDKCYMNVTDFDGQENIYEPTYKELRILNSLSKMKYKYGPGGVYFSKGPVNWFILTIARVRLKGLNPIAWSTALLLTTGDDYTVTKENTLAAFQKYLPLKKKDVEPFM